MKIDNALKEFPEKYDREAIQSIDDLSNSFEYTINPHTIKGFNIKESFDIFNEYITAYSQYKIKNKGNDNASPHSAICESVSKFIDTQIFKSSDLLYQNMPSFVESYINGITELGETINTIKRDMIDADVDVESVGDVNEFCDKFMTIMQESFDKTMTDILRTTGYTTRKNFESIRPNTKKPVFL